MAAPVAIFDLVLLAGTDALAATRSLTCCFLARFLLDVIALYVTLGRSCSCTLGANRVSRDIARVCLTVSLSDSISGVARFAGMLLLGENGSVCCGEWSFSLRLVVGCASAAGIASCSTTLCVRCCYCSNWRLSNSVPLLLVPLRVFEQVDIACIILPACVTVKLVVFL